MLEKNQIELIEQVLTAKADKHGHPYLKQHELKAWEAFMGHINSEVLEIETLEVNRKKAWYTEHIGYGSEVSGIMAIKGELEFSLDGMLDCAKQGNARATNYHLNKLLGTYWERMFCCMLNRLTMGQGYVHRFQKWQQLGAGRLAKGDPMVGKGITLPDVIFIVSGHWILGEVKHETLTTAHHTSIGAGYYGLPEKDFERIVRLSRVKPFIPLWFIVHEHLHTGKWGTQNREVDWRAGDFIGMGEPTITTGGRGRTLWQDGIDAPRAYWHKDKFTPLDEALEGLRIHHD